ncbi:MAG: hypothetical protein ACOCQ6_01490, partial [Bacteroidota bacterium]
MAQESVSEPHYCFVRVEGRIDKKLSVEVDLGESDKADKLEDQIEKDLRGSRSYVQVLQYFLDLDYELERTLDQVFLSSSGGGSEGIGYLLKRPGIEN